MAADTFLGYDYATDTYDRASDTYDGGDVGPAGSPMWGPWRPIKPRPLVRGSVSIRIPRPRVTVTGTVLENEDWLLLLT